MSAPKTDAQAIAEMTAALARAGITVPATEVAALVASYRFVRAGLDALNARLEDGAEPAAAFDPRRAGNER